MTLRIFTIGHSTRSAGEIVAMLANAGVRYVADVRRFPMSRRHPQFNRDALSGVLDEAGIGYTHLPDLGGRREPRADSTNTGWREAGFRGYADYMETPPFMQALDELMDVARCEPVAIMCAEASWRSCHRGLIADALKLRGWAVIHLVDAERHEPHPWTAPARVTAGRLAYSVPAPAQRSLDL